MKKLASDFSHCCRKAFNKNNSHLFVIVNHFLSFVIFVSIIALILDSMKEFHMFHAQFLFIEYLAVAIFTIEYICRIIASKRKVSYIFSFYGIIDLLSMFPTYLHIVNLAPLKSIRTLRILRVFRITRMAKLTRFEHLEKETERVHNMVDTFNLQMYFLATFVAVLILGNLAYIFEHGHPHFENIPLSMLWVLESILGGSITTVVPETYGGIAIMMTARFTGFVLLGFLIHTIGDIASQMLLGKKWHKHHHDDDSGF